MGRRLSIEFRVEGGVAVLEQEADGFLQIAVEFVECLALAVGAGESGDVPDIQPGGGSRLGHSPTRCFIDAPTTRPGIRIGAKEVHDWSFTRMLNEPAASRNAPVLGRLRQTP
jgi:hypothetical protein